ncbi:MAG: phosphomannomutase/phosphoglucomutase [Candidatus Fermentithermobacillus carboniphilus]|uniref:Phosphomannomutase/phosphoglucomutase n=1 Tax=Candidatus Fermentithermobacillus carboniphilus TaxID=3085328 RepID=A0AAT9LC37_9FIRM|nr:MAG: phosphomannomutase/phosphoglucomutase [Candidatus Fermentithermobacillus carboniphilus]
MVQIDSSIFREYDIRGITGRQLTLEVARLVGLGYGTYCLENGIDSVVVGRDVRQGSEELHNALVDGLMSAGCRVVDIGTAVTPLLYFACRVWGIDGGVMVTASHNPPEYNGFKLVWGKGTLYGDALQRLKEMIVRGEFVDGRGTYETRDAFSGYLQWLRDRFDLSGIRVGIDCGNGAAGLFAPKVFSELGCEVSPLYCDPDPTFPNHLPDPVRKGNMRDLAALVTSRSLDVGLAFDGDGDRLGVVDDAGREIWGDRVMILFSREVLARHPGAKILVEVKCSQALIDEISRLGGYPILWKTGHSLIKAKMLEEKALLAGEMSGHMFFADEYFGFDDAIYAGCRLLRLMRDASLPLSRMLADVPVYYSTPEVRVHCPEDMKRSVVERAKDRLRRVCRDLVDVDGARATNGDGWVLVRASNTEPCLILRAESSTQEGLRRLSTLLTDVLACEEGVDLHEWLTAL